MPPGASSVAVGMAAVGGPGGDPPADQADDVGGGVEGRVDGVGHHGHRAGAQPDEQFGGGHQQVEAEHNPQPAANGLVAVWRRESGGKHTIIVNQTSEVCREELRRDEG